jgi:RNA polymerase sigma factor (sigma-70 family)
VLGRLARRYRDFDGAEDAVQEALIAAANQWASDGVPLNPLAWLTTVASRRLIEMWRRDSARHRREEAAAENAASCETADDDVLTLFFLCCHPSLTTASQVALTLRAVGGFTTVEIARAFLVPESTMGQRISRAKQAIRAAGAEFAMPAETAWTDRLAAVEKVLYLIFNEGYAATAGPSLTRVDLSREAIRLTRQLHSLIPHDTELTGLLSLMLLTDARRPARTGADGSLVPLAEQDRSLWDKEAIREGTALLTAALESGPLGPYQIQAAIAAVHDEAKTPEETDWRQILVLYDMLHLLAPGPMVTLNRVVAFAMIHGAGAALDELSKTVDEEDLAHTHRLHAVRAHLLEMAGDLDAAVIDHQLAADRTLSIPEQRYLRSRAARLRSSRR